MKIGILTQPLHNNYGGLLQAFVLQKVLTDKGHDVLTIDLVSKKQSLLRKGLSFFKRLSQRYIFRKEVSIIRSPNKEEWEIITKNTRRFIIENIKLTEKYYAPLNFLSIKKYEFDALVVGSDQVWRPKYSPHLPNFFLDFVPKNNPYTCIAFAASFGVDIWEFNSHQTAMAKEEIQKFHALSVREDSAVKLCERFLDKKASLVLDPTMLLSKYDYIRIFELEQQARSEGKLFTYILDETPGKKSIINQVSQDLGFESFTVMPNKKFSEVGAKGIYEAVYPPVEKWLRAFMDAEFVVTDSFHGTVFSIIFNKPFISLGNMSRGLSRFESLLRQFGLENRLIDLESELLLNSIIDQVNWDEVNLKLNSQIDNSLSFLSDTLTAL